MGLVAGALRGALAGAIATAAMDLVWYRRYRNGGGESDFATWEFTTSAEDFSAHLVFGATLGIALTVLGDDKLSSRLRSA